MAIRAPNGAKNARKCISSIYHDREIKKNLQDVLLVRCRMCSKDVLSRMEDFLRINRCVRAALDILYSIKDVYKLYV